MHAIRFLSALTVWWGLACGSQPVTNAALPGSTVTLAIGGDDNPGFNTLRGPIGYGSEVYDAAFGPDQQRGELDIRLLDGSPQGIPLATRMTFRVYPDPASDTGISQLAHPVWGPGVGIAQTLAVVDIPGDAPPSVQPYALQIRTVHRDASGAVTEVLHDLSHEDQALTILDPVACGVTGTPTPNLALNLDFYVEDSSPQMPGLVPHPKLVLDLFPGAHPVTPPLPGAAHVELEYPPGVTIRSVFEDRRLGRSSLVSWQDDPETRRLRIDLVAPEEDIRHLAVVFQASAPLGTADFVVDDAATTLYDGNGEPMARQARPVAIQ